MRKLLLLIVCCTLLVACTPIEKKGLSEYSPLNSSVEITNLLFPHESFLTVFPYESGDYYYYSAEDFIWGYETAMAYVTYDKAGYEQAKAFCAENYVLCENHQYSCCDQVFYHVMAIESSDTLDSVCRYPEMFNMYSFDDQNNTLYFLGYWNGNPNDEEQALATQDFPQFIEIVFPVLFNKTGDGSLS